MVAFSPDPDSPRRRTQEKGEKSILLLVCRYDGKHESDPHDDNPHLGSKVNEWWIIKSTAAAAGPKLFKLLKFPAPDPNHCFHESNCAIADSSLYLLGGADKYGNPKSDRNITCRLETLNPSAGWKSLDFQFPFHYNNAIVESIGNWIFMFPNLTPFIPLDQKCFTGNQTPKVSTFVYDTNLWGYAFNTVEKNGFPIPPPPANTLFWSSIQCCGFLDDKQIVVSVNNDVFAYNAVDKDKSWQKLDERISNPHKRYLDARSIWDNNDTRQFSSSAHSNGVLYIFELDPHKKCVLHCYDARRGRKFKIDLDRYHINHMEDHDQMPSIVPVGDSTLCFLWHIKAARIGRCFIQYAKIKLCFRDEKCSPKVTVLEKMNFDYVDFDHLTDCLPFDDSVVEDQDMEEMSFSKYSEIKELKMKQLEKVIDEEMGVECPRTRRQNWNEPWFWKWKNRREKLEIVAEKIFLKSSYQKYITQDAPSPCTSALNHHQAAGSFFSEYKGYLARGCNFLRKFIKK